MNFIELIQEKLGRNLVTDLEITNFLSGSSYRRYALIKRALAKGQLIHIRRGLYCLGKRYQKGPLNLLVVAQKIYGPSYVSFESALSYHGWIPEAVRTVTSATSKRARTFETPLGVFTYSHIPSDPLLAGVFRETVETDSYFMAGPWKAIADYVYLYKKDWRGLKPLIQSLRIDEENLNATKEETLLELESSYRSRHVREFLKGIRKDLAL